MTELLSEDLFSVFKDMADAYENGHFTILKFTTGYKAMIGTPDFDSGKGLEQILKIETKDTIKKAALEALKRYIDENPTVCMDEL